ncbi:MAG: LysR family transcriptional regulator, partial [Pseudomonadota bacterium]
CHGFSLLTPTLLIDGMVENMNLRLLELPVAGLSRTLTVVARTGELQDLPSAVAELTTQVLKARVAAYVGDTGTNCIV